MSDNDELISRFTDVTGIDTDQARFYLESAAWNLENALMSFYENENDDRQQNISDDNDIQEITPSDAPARPKSNAETGGASASAPKAATNSRFATVSSLNKDSSDEEEGQAFYAGGSEHSGQQVLGPGKKKHNIVAEMFRTVQEHGAEVVDPREQGGGKKKTFTGTGYRLGQSNNDSEVIGPPSSTSSSGSREVNMTLKMWREGFSINDGQLRRYSDPETREFLQTVGRGEVPEELVREAHGGEVHLNMEDHSHEEFLASKPKLRAFTGKGNVLGSPTPHTVVAPTSSNEQDKTNNEEKAKEAVPVESSEPTTTIQIRLADGSRLVATFNHTHTIGDLRNYITTARPEYSSRRFNLLTSFPSKELDDNGKTLADAGILNSAIMQRMT